MWDLNEKLANDTGIKNSATATLDWMLVKYKDYLQK